MRQRAVEGWRSLDRLQKIAVVLVEIMVLVQVAVLIYLAARI